MDAASPRPQPRARDGFWLSRERLLVLVLIGVTVLVFYVCYRIALPFLSPLAWALALGVIAYPVHRAVCRRVPSANVAAAATVATVAIVLVAPAMFVTHQIVKQAGLVIQLAREELETGRWRQALGADPRLAPVLAWVEENFDPSDVTERVTGLAQTAAPGLVGGSIWLVAEVLITLFALFYFVRDRRHITGALRTLVPLSHRETDAVITRVTDTIHATVFGSLVVAAVQGTMGGLMFWVLGLPGPLVWGAIMALLAVVPALGTFVVWGPAAVYLAVTGSVGKALLLVGWGAVAIGLIDNVLYPVLVGTKLRLHPLPVFISVVGGLLLFGGAGLVLGPVTFAVALALVDIWRLRTEAGRPAEAPVQTVDPRAA
jgi:predicted PurR-regulated permease PerM